ncbi:MAG: alpha/beta hydrolase family protein [Saccharospirillaceae bacterium]|nr:alpha/beta hydrolase family protein [Saccharospirillaceae bacterium]
MPLNQHLTALDIPMLDLISAQSISPAYANHQRAGAMRHKQRQQYQQIAIPAFDLTYDDSNPIVRRVRGWLKTNAAGTELATKTTATP